MDGGIGAFERERWTARVHPLWLRAPIRLARWPGPLLTLVFSTLVLGVATFAGPSFLSAAGTRLINQEIDALPDGSALIVSTTGASKPSAWNNASLALGRLLYDVDGLGNPIRTFTTSSIQTGTLMADGPRIRLLARTGAPSHIEVLRRGDTGAWVPDTLARELDLRPGDTFMLKRGLDTRQILVGGIYKDLATIPLTPYWKPLATEVNPPVDAGPRPPFVLLGEEDFRTITRDFVPDIRYRWSYPLPTELSLERARRMRAELVEVLQFSSDRIGPLSQAFAELSLYSGGPEITAPVVEVVERVEAAVDSLGSSIVLLTLLAQAVALAVVCAAAIFIQRARTGEARLLLSRGVGPFAQGLRIAAESLAPVVIGLGSGATAAWSLVREFGPDESLPAPSRGELGPTFLAIVAPCLVLIAVSATLTIHAELRPVGRRARQRAGRMRWDLVLLVFAAVSLYELVRRESLIQGGEPDLLVLAWPILLVAGVVALGVRLLVRALPHLRRVTEKRSIAAYLATRRLAVAPGLARLFVGVAAVAVGVLVYASTTVASLEETTRAKTLVAAGADVVTTIPYYEQRPDLPFPVTPVNRIRAELGLAGRFGGEPVEILAIRPAEFARVAYWHESFSDTSLAELLERLRNDSTAGVAAIVVGAPETPEEALLRVSVYDVTVTTVGRTTAWPGAGEQTTVVVDAARYWRAAREAGADRGDRVLVGHELWARGNPDRIRDAFEQRGLSGPGFRSAVELGEVTGLTALTWTYGLLQALGVLIGCIGLVGAVLYLDARETRREVGYTMARRMGLERGQHRRALGFELGGLLATAALFGVALGLIAARVVMSKLDPLPELPPSPLLALPGDALIVVALAVPAAAFAGAWWVQYRLDRTRVAEVMRVG